MLSSTGDRHDRLLPNQTAELMPVHSDKAFREKHFIGGLILAGDYPQRFWVKRQNDRQDKDAEEPVRQPAALGLLVCG